MLTFNVNLSVLIYKNCEQKLNKNILRMYPLDPEKIRTEKNTRKNKNFLTSFAFCG